MTITANSGPIITYGITVSSTGGQGEYNEQRGPSLVDLGDGLLDPRQQFNYGYQPGQQATQVTMGFYGLQGIVDFVPSALSTNAIANHVNATPGGTVLGLTSTGAGITTSVSITAPETGKVVSGLIAVDGVCGGSSLQGIAFGSAGSINIWNTGTLAGRCLTITSSVNDSGGAYTIIGRDAYGFKMTEQIVGPNAATVTTQKAFKYIASITSSGTINSTGVSVGTADVFGFPMVIQNPAYVTCWAGAVSSMTLVVVSTGFHTLGSTRATQTSTTPDVRGTIGTSAVGANTNGTTFRVTMFASPTVTALSQVTGASTSFAGLFGLQFSSV